MTSMVAQLRISLGLDSAAFDTGMRNASQQVNALGINMRSAQASFARFDQGLVQAGQSAIRTGNQLQQVRDRSGQMQSGLQQLGFQLQDITVQFASGQRAATIFAQQLPQVFGALSQMASATTSATGVLGRMAGFLSGPWGVAIGVGAAVLPTLIGKLFDTGDAARQATADLQTTAQAARALVGAENALKLVSAQTERNKLKDREMSLELEIQKRGVRNPANGKLMFVYKQQKELLDVRQQLLKQEAEIRSAEEQNAAAARVASPAVVSRISRVSGRGDGGVSERSRQAAASTDGFARSLENLRDKLFPEVKALEDYRAELAQIDLALKQHKLTLEEAEEWRRRLAMQGRNMTTVAEDLFKTDDLDARVSKLTERLATINLAANDNASKTRRANQEVQESFETMAQGVIGSLQGMAYAVKSGGFLDILSGLLNLGLQLGGIGAFGKSIQANIKAMPAHADGTMFSAGGLALVGERGPEVVNLPRGTRVWKHGTGPGGGGNIYNFTGNLMTPEFFAQIQQGNVAAARAGGELGYRKVVRSGSRRLG